MASIQLPLVLISFMILHFLPGSHVNSATFTILNKCDYSLWPGILSNAGTPQLSPTGFTLLSGDSTTLTAPTSWSGRIWGRTYCSQSGTSFSCTTADCSSGMVECKGSGAIPPATLAEFTLNGANGLDFYDVSLVDGYNIDMLVAPQGGTGGNCSSTGCVSDLNIDCPSELRVVMDGSDETVACRSACEAFGDAQYCCSGAYSSPNTCKPSSYSEYFKRGCPQAYSYAYDDATSTFTCASANYLITFCPSPITSSKAWNGSNPEGSAVSVSGSCHYRCCSITIFIRIVIATAWVSLIWRLI